uniref:IMS import disulfide relay-system CHCH-CHCH-like Cx9C domain-containing protein n=1 Tax=Aplanochytrium stocchinoi TaxID=215587 RepID=A0A7S3PJ49_9STRA|mmetsp:Transcript_17791/g.21928  ORF Transcript_17791/g.21928 Transcript_17791/m.21928 type:complete len:107 (-) Transcript_17791:615-935(-)
MSGDHTVQAYTSLLQRFDKLLGSCEWQSVAYSECISDSRKTEKCSKQAKEYTGCLHERNVKTQRVLEKCGKLYSNYEICMGNKQDQGCVQELAELLDCAVSLSQNP